MAKAQFYLLTAFIFVFLVYSLNSGVWFLSKTSDPFEELKENYVYEVNKAINSAILDNEDVFLRVNEFTKKFLFYAKTRNIDFSLVFILSQDGHLKIVNYLNNNINIYYKNNKIAGPISQFGFKQIDWYDEITVKFDGKEYSFKFSDENSVELKALFKGEMRG